MSDALKSAFEDLVKQVEKLTAQRDDLLADNRRNQELFAKLTAERDAARKDAASAQNAVSEWYDKVRAVEAERDAARDAALEEAAKMCEELRGFRPNECDHIAWLIRAMKENRDE